MARMTIAWTTAGILAFALAAGPLSAGSQDILGKLGTKQDYRSRRVSSYDKTGKNADWVRIEPGETIVLADIKGPAAIHHLWVTADAEPFYGRKLVLRAFWDGEESPSIEAPLGDFFGVGHGLDLNMSSLPIVCSSEGRARNAYWSMPFRWTARLTITNEGARPVEKFYYYVDYRELPDLDPEAPYFHAQYRQEMPCESDRNYLLLDASGRGHYVGCNLNVLQRADGWWGEGDDMIFVDGEETPSLHGTGSEDYFSDAWGMRVSANLFYGCTFQEAEYPNGGKASVYRFHIPDPITFKKSIRVTIEHGNRNDRSDYFSSTAYWYQAEPHAPFPEFPAVEKRLPFAMETMSNFILPRWRYAGTASRSVYEDAAAGMTFAAPRLAHALTSYYDPGGTRFPVLSTEGAAAGTKAELGFTVKTAGIYDIDLYFVRGPAMGDIRILLPASETGAAPKEAGAFSGYSERREMGVVSLKAVSLREGANGLIFEITGRDQNSAGMDMSFMGVAPAASAAPRATD